MSISVLILKIIKTLNLGKTVTNPSFASYVLTQFYFTGIWFKVLTFWEGHKILPNFPLTFDYSRYSQKQGEDFAKFCGLLRIYELYVEKPEILTIFCLYFRRNDDFRNSCWNLLIFSYHSHTSIILYWLSLSRIFLFILNWNNLMQI